jgi:non-specific serine/threonine protein kinase
MKTTLALSPSGSLYLVDGESSPAPPTGVLSLLDAKRSSEALFVLAASKSAALPPTYLYWRDFSAEYMQARCNTVGDETLQKLEKLSTERAQSMVDNAAPMLGGEYLSADLLQRVWSELDEWLLAEVQQNFSGLHDFLKERAPLWHASGQVYFHLAENRNDPKLPFAFMATWLPQQDGLRARHQPLATALTQFAAKRQQKRLLELLEPIVLASKNSVLIDELVSSKAIYKPQAWGARQAYDFLQQVPLLQQSGVIVRLPDWWAKRTKPQVQATLSTVNASALNVAQLLRFNVNAVLDGEPLSPDEWQALMQNDSGLMLLRGKWVEVDREKLSEAMQHMGELEEQGNSGGLSFFEGMRLLAGANYEASGGTDEVQSQTWRFVAADKPLAELLHKILHPETLRSKLPGAALKAQLRPYQENGVRWLWQLNQLGLGACLADDMGLGKTIQVLSLLLLLKKQNVKHPSLLVLPTSLLGNWQAEMSKFAPSLNACFVHSAMVDKKSMAEWAQQGIPENTDIVLTSYGMLPRQPWLLKQQWNTVILDEAQAIKNAGSRQSKTSKSLRAFHRIALTGTPIENRLSDLWSLFDFINPGLLGSFKQFKQFSKVLESRETEQYAPLRRLVQPYILRRLKTDKSVISDLPDKSEVVAWCGLTKRQATLYQKNVNELGHLLQSTEGMKRRGLVLSYILRFKQICNHPSQFLDETEFKANESGKFLRLEEICEEVIQRQQKILVFTQFRQMCEPLAGFLTQLFGRQGLVLHGGTSPKKRQQMVADFQADEGPPFFVLSLKAGGTGLNLTAASHVVHFDRWWNPAVENQATDRAFRIGQKRNVLVHKFVNRGTIEEKIDAVLEDKNAMADGVLNGTKELSLTEMDNDAILDLVRLDLQHTIIN